MGRIILITSLFLAACKTEPKGSAYDGTEVTCDCDDPAKMLLVYNSCVIARGKHLDDQCFDVACKSVCPIEIDWSE